jgi:hypothetical protein
VARWRVGGTMLSVSATTGGATKPARAIGRGPGILPQVVPVGAPGRRVGPPNERPGGGGGDGEPAILPQTGIGQGMPLGPRNESNLSDCGTATGT